MVLIEVVRVPVKSAAGLIGFFLPNQDLCVSVYEALRAVCGVAANHADGEHFLDVFRTGEKLWHWTEGASQIVKIQACTDDPLAVVREVVHHLDQFVVEKLGLVDPDNHGVFYEGRNLSRSGDLEGPEALAGVRADGVFRVTNVNGRFNDGNRLLGVLGATDAADEFFGLAAEHAADDDFDPSHVLRE